MSNKLRLNNWCYVQEVICEYIRMMRDSQITEPRVETGALLYM